MRCWCWLGVAGLVLSLGACSSSTDDGSRGSARDGLMDFGVAGAAGAAGTGATSGFGQQPTGGVSAAGGVGGIINPDKPTCGGSRVEPDVIEIEVEVEVTEAEPIAIFIMLDQSGSMITLWPGAVQAITDFVNDPLSAGLDVALGVFPALSFGGMCEAATYSPPPIPFGRLPNHAAALTGGLPAGPVGIGTPIEGALRGSTEICKNFTPADPADAGEECVVLFVTDGDPSDDCAQDTPTLVAAASQAGVPVYTIALPGVTNLDLLNQIASSTGTDCDPGGPNNACDLTGGASFVDALTSIRDTVTTIETRIETQVQALPCQWGIPPPDPGKTFIKEELNVVFTTAPGQPEQLFKKVAGQADCGQNVDAWYYDNDADPTRVVACPSTCTALEAAEMGAVDIQLGCPTVVLE